MSSFLEKVIESNNTGECDCCYDVIQFVATIAPKFDFGLVYLNGKAYFENMSKSCLECFFDKFKLLDIIPTRLLAFRNNSYNIEINAIDIYENSSKQMKSINTTKKCSNETLKVLNCFNFLLQLFNSSDFCLVVSKHSLEISGIVKDHLTIIVDKMRNLNLMPRKIYFSSLSNFNIIFHLEEILHLTENDNSENCLSNTSNDVVHESLSDDLINNSEASLSTKDNNQINTLNSFTLKNVTVKQVKPTKRKSEESKKLPKEAKDSKKPLIMKENKRPYRRKKKSMDNLEVVSDQLPSIHTDIDLESYCRNVDLLTTSNLAGNSLSSNDKDEVTFGDFLTKCINDVKLEASLEHFKS